MSHTTSLLKYWRLAWFSGPRCEQALYRRIHRLQPGKIVEIGIGTGIRSTRMFQLAGRYCLASEIRYTGIDLFESRASSSARLSLKNAYCLFRSQGIQVRLLPGDPATALKMAAHSLSRTDLIVIDADYTANELTAAWRWMRLIMHDQSRVMWFRRENGSALSELTVADIDQLVDNARSVSRAA